MQNTVKTLQKLKVFAIITKLHKLPYFEIVSKNTGW